MHTKTEHEHTQAYTRLVQHSNTTSNSTAQQAHHTRKIEGMGGSRQSSVIVQHPSPRQITLGAFHDSWVFPLQLCQTIRVIWLTPVERHLKNVQKKDSMR